MECVKKARVSGKPEGSRASKITMRGWQNKEMNVDAG